MILQSPLRPLAPLPLALVPVVAGRSARVVVTGTAEGGSVPLSSYRAGQPAPSSPVITDAP